MDQLTFVEKVAHKLTHLGLAGPAILLLEAHKPLAFIGSQFLLVAQPSLNLFVPSPFTQNLIDLLADPAQLDQLISRLEQTAVSGLTPSEQSGGLNKEARP